MFRHRERAFKQFKCPRPQCVNFDVKYGFSGLYSEFNENFFPDGKAVSQGYNTEVYHILRWISIAISQRLIAILLVRTQYLARLLLRHASYIILFTFIIYFSLSLQYSLFSCCMKCNFCSLFLLIDNTKP